MQNCWFKEWFNTKYYHILYKNRDDDEAQFFIDNLLEHLDLKANAKILDVACGKGRHSVYLSSKGFEVTGIDLSSESIEFARMSETKTVSFFEHDMRQPFRINYFDVAVNLFTSLGYFDDDNDNYKAVKAISNSLKKDGFLVIDFFNAQHVINNLIHHFETEIDGVKFIITKKIEHDFVVKNIEIIDGDIMEHYQEKVQLISLTNFENYFKAANLKVKWLKGDYSLNTYDKQFSPRLILCAQKI